MNEQDKQLLLKVLCEMLPHGIHLYVEHDWFEDEVPPYTCNVTAESHDIITNFANNPITCSLSIKPYLRPINTITKSEIADAIKYICDTDNVVWDNGTHGVGFYFYKSDGIKRPFDDFKFRLGCYGPKNIDWLNKFHFDYRGLIEKGLALEAPEGMYNI